MFKRFFAFKDGYRPNYDDAKFVKRLCRVSQAVRDHCRSKPESARDVHLNSELISIASYFRQRRAPRFFIDIEETEALVTRVSRDFPSWRRKTIRDARQYGDDVLRIYGSEVAGLANGFSWDDLPYGPGKDKLYAKRPHRFAFAPRMALASLYGQTTDKVLRKVFLSWMDHAQSRSAVMTHDSNLAVIQRILSLTWTFIFLRARSEKVEPEDLLLEASVLKIIFSDVQFLAPRLGDSYPNNHLLADVFAGWFIGAVWPEFVPKGDWRKSFEPLWLEQFHRQVLPDGSSFEHSIHYHEFACEMGSAYVILNDRNGYSTPPDTLELVRRALRFQADLAGPGGEPLVIGDSVEEPLFPLDGGAGWGTGAWREIARTRFSEQIAPSRAGDAAIERAFWLLGGRLADRGVGIDDNDAEDPSGLARYEHGGIYVFLDEAMKWRLVFRTGPRAGDAICAGHMHADLMSVYLASESQPFIIDAGNYTYRSNASAWPAAEPAWRHYFRGPAAHNALCVEGVDPLGDVDKDFREQSIDTSVEVAHQVAGETASWVEASVSGNATYDGYRRGVVHILGHYSLVYDVLPPRLSASQCRLLFQFAQGVVQVAGAENITQYIAGDRQISIAASSGAGLPQLLHGSRNPLGGWVSPRYGEITAAPQIAYCMPDHRTCIGFVISSGASDVSVSAEAIGDSTLVFRMRTSNLSDTLILHSGDSSEPVISDGIEFLGELLWLRQAGGEPRALRWANAKSVSCQSLGIRVSSRTVQPEIAISAGDNGVVVEHCPLDSLTLRWPD